MCNKFLQHLAHEIDLIPESIELNANSIEFWSMQDLIFKLDEILREEIDSELVELIKKEIDRRC